MPDRTGNKIKWTCIFFPVKCVELFYVRLKLKKTLESFWIIKFVAVYWKFYSLKVKIYLKNNCPEKLFFYFNAKEIEFLIIKRLLSKGVNKKAF